MSRSARLCSVTACLMALAFVALDFLVVLGNRSGSGHAADLPLLLTIVGQTIPAPIYAAVAALILWRYPRQPVAWTMLVLSFTWDVSLVSPDYERYALITHPGSLPLASAAASISTWTYAINLLLFFWLVMLFPNGRLGGTSRASLLAGTIGLVSIAIITALAPGPSGVPSIPNPLGIWTAPFALNAVATVLAISSFPIAAAAILQRFRSSRGAEREQIKWFAFGGAIAMIVMLLATLTGWSGLGLFFGVAALASLPITIGIAILRHNLYDIDLLINRTLVYGLLTASLGSIYVGFVLGLQVLFRSISGQQSELAVAIATLAVAALFNPWRQRLQAFIDRRFYRRRYDATRTLSRLSATLRDEVDLDRLLSEVASVVADALEPASIAVWVGSKEA